MKIHIQLDSQCEEPEILIRTAAVTAEIRELVEKSQGNTAQKRLLHPTVQKAVSLYRFTSRTVRPRP